MKQLFRGGIVVSGDGMKQLDVLVKGEKILAMGENLAFRDVEEIDVTGKLLFPGFVDSHIHMEQEALEILTKGDIETGTKAEIAGGTTCIIDYAVQEPGKSLAEVLEKRSQNVDEKVRCDYALHLVLTEWNADVSEELEKIMAEGVHSLRLYMPEDITKLDDKDIYKMLARVKELGGIAGFQCENRGIIQARRDETARDGGTGGEVSDYLYARPVLAEAEMIGRILKIAGCVDTPVIIMNLSTKAGYEEIRRARKEGQTVYVEIGMPYLLFDDEKYTLEEEEAVKYITVPPLRSKEDREFLWKMLENDEIQVAASNYGRFPGGGERPAMMYHLGVGQGKITAEQLCRYLSENPAKLYHIYPQKGALAPGSDADIVVWNPDEEWKVSAASQQSAPDFNPYDGMELRGRAEQVYLRGALVAEAGQIKEAYSGRYVKAGR